MRLNNRTWVSSTLLATLIVSAAVAAPPQRAALSPSVGRIITSPHTNVRGPRTSNYGNSLITPYPAATSLGGLPLPAGFSAPVGGSTIGLGPGAYNVVGGRNQYGGGRHNRSGSGFGYGGVPFFPFYGGLPYDSSSYWQDPSQAQPAPLLDGSGQDGDRLASEIQRLSNEISQLRDSRGGQPAPGEDGVSQDTSQQAPQTPPQIPVTVVLRNGTRFDAGNYAVMDRTFWDFTGPAPRKFPIANIDVDASIKATEAKGGEFPQLTPGN